MADKTGEKFVNKIPEFLEWLKEAGLQDKLSNTAIKSTSLNIDIDHPLYGKKFVMTGFRDKELVEKLLKVGAIQGSSVSKNTFVVLVKIDKDEVTAKAEEARKLDIPIMTRDEFVNKYFK
jgi:NAD-dependent DNA ligase